MTKLNPIDPNQAQGKAKELLDNVQQAMGATPNIFTTFAHAPAAMEGYLSLNGALSGGKLDGKLRESLAMTVAGFNGCDYCASAHTFLGDKAGIDAAELEANMKGQSSDARTQAALTFATKILETRGHPAQSDLDAVHEAGFSDEEAIEILAHVALNTFTNYFNETFGVEIDFPAVSTQTTRKAA